MKPREAKGRNTICVGAVLCILCGVTVAPASAGEWDREKEKLTSSCSNLFSNVAQVGSCGAFLFNSGEPLRFMVPQSVVPGGGTALGLTLIEPVDLKNWSHSNFTMEGGSSLRQFWFTNAMLTLSHKRWGGQWNTARDRFEIRIYGHARGLPQMPFYGIGPNTSRSNLTNFRERDLWTGATVINPLSEWLNTSVTMDYLKPEVRGVQGTTIRSIDNYYAEATAPGLLRQPGFAHFQVAVQPKHNWEWTRVHSQVAYNRYQDLGAGTYSFSRFRTEFLQTIYPESQKEPTNGGTGFRRQPRYSSVLSIAGRFSSSWAAANHAVPFYLQETLGGSDIDNVPTLRGFQDYRFRGPDLFSLQAQYERRLLPSPKPGSDRPSTLRTVAGAVGLLAFYDAGEVAGRVQDLSFSKVRHSFGFGLTFWSGDRVWFRAYIGLGSGEGSHTFLGVSTQEPQQALHF